MSESDRRSTEESSPQPGSAESEQADTTGCYETVDQQTRERVLDRDGHRCQTCGYEGPGAGGLATLHVHHIERDPDGVDEHDPANLTTLCRACHSWLHQQSSRDDVPVELSDEDVSRLLAQDIEILRFLVEEGPAGTGEIADAVTADLTVAAVRERLWVLMGLDKSVTGREQQLVDKDVETNEWGLPSQVETSARGHIPGDRQLLIQRVEDEQVRRALDRGCDRDMVTAVLGISERSTFYKEKRARAFDIPLDAIAGRGGSSASQSAHGEGSVSAGGAGQQRLDAIDESADAEPVETWGSPADDEVAADSTTSDGGQASVSEMSEELQATIERAIAVFEEGESGE
jgi:hypothetical protein